MKLSMEFRIEIKPLSKPSIFIFPRHTHTHTDTQTQQDTNTDAPIKPKHCICDFFEC